jgi:Ca2+-binding RTX toxin-like protein
MQGRLGNDRYFFRDALNVQTDTIAEFNGGGTTDMIDFSGITNTLTGVNVDLRTSGQTIATHAARTVNVSVAGQAAAIESIVGGAGNDILIGNNAANYIRGNDGRDILVGGAGVDFLTGSAGDDILIGGNTSHTLSNLQKIQQEWLSSNSYSVRLDHIRGPNSGMNGQNFLAFDTVFEDSVADTLKGDLDDDWFWVGTGDTDDLDGLFPPEQEN